MKKRAFLWILSFAFGIIMSGGASAAEGTGLYHAQHKRDPFVPLVGNTTRRSAAGLLGVENIDEIQIEGVMLDADPRESVVVVNGSMLKTGEEVGGVKVLAIRQEGAQFSVNGVEGFKPLYQDETKSKN